MLMAPFAGDDLMDRINPVGARLLRVLDPALHTELVVPGPGRVLGAQAGQARLGEFVTGRRLHQSFPGSRRRSYPGVRGQGLSPGDRIGPSWVTGREDARGIGKLRERMSR
jgi:hypothetical protein